MSKGTDRPQCGEGRDPRRPPGAPPPWWEAGEASVLVRHVGLWALSPTAHRAVATHTCHTHGQTASGQSPGQAPHVPTHMHTSAHAHTCAHHACGEGWLQGAWGDWPSTHVLKRGHTHFQAGKWSLAKHKQPPAPPSSRKEVRPGPRRGGAERGLWTVKGPGPGATYAGISLVSSLGNKETETVRRKEGGCRAARGGAGGAGPTPRPPSRQRRW